ncbi:UDP-glycosyltransferase UGT5-like [Tribolium madens]|uniref:UDP-glycosyltransferase UGT5-like n=1 Tax=Tribolium madens TaxID=41895 RepID=UPI001CF76748|nr:UDP-glycosyltransferase UGT5-like [Tribolium madens]
MKHFLACPVIFVALLLCKIQCSKILMVYQMPAHSHYSLGLRIAKELAERGHQVTVINPYPQKTPIKNFRDVSVEEHIEFIEEFKRSLFSRNSMSLYENINFLIRLGAELTNQTLGHKNVKKLLRSGETFDILIAEYFFNDAIIGLGYYFKIPIVLTAPNAISGVNNNLFANPTPASYVPHVLSQYNKHMNFWKRLHNCYIVNLSNLMKEFILMPRHRKIFKQHISQDVELDETLNNVSLVLTNSHVSVTDAVPHQPNMIEIGGYHIYPPKKLPEDLQKFLDNAKEGAILFSMGSNLKSQDLKPEMKAGILAAFSKIKQKVLWKFEVEFKDVPDNVKIVNWVPQQDVLAHPNIIAFISHGGLLSTIETVYHGVPIIGIPVFGDQQSNIATAVANGYAISINLFELNEVKLSWALNEIFKNPMYRENAKQRSKLMQDQPLKPIDVAIYWVEHVIRHQGAPHLRSAALDLSWYQREMVDIFGFLGLIVVAICTIIYLIFQSVFRVCFNTKIKISSGKKNK